MASTTCVRTIAPRSEYTMTRPGSLARGVVSASANAVPRVVASVYRGRQAGGPDECVSRWRHGRQQHDPASLAHGDDGAREGTVDLRAQVGDDGLESSVRLRRRGGGTGRPASDKRNEEGGAGPHGGVAAGAGGGGCRRGSVESGNTSPWPIGYAGGMRLGSLPRIGDRPSSARLAARSAARTPLQAMRYDFTVGAWFNRYGLPRETSTVGLAESVAMMSRAIESGRAMVP